KALGKPLGLPGAIQGVAFHPDGKTFVVAGFGGDVKSFDTATQKPQGLSVSHPRVGCLAFSPDGKILATGGYAHSAWLWDATTGRPVCSPLQHQGGVVAVAFSPDSKTLLTAGEDRAARLWDVATGLRLGPLLVHHSRLLAAFQPRTGDIITFTGDGFLRRWDGPLLSTQQAVAARKRLAALT